MKYRGSHIRILYPGVSNAMFKHDVPKETDRRINLNSSVGKANNATENCDIELIGPREKMEQRRSVTQFLTPGSRPLRGARRKAITNGRVSKKGGQRRACGAPTRKLKTVSPLHLRSRKTVKSNSPTVSRVVDSLCSPSLRKRNGMCTSVLQVLQHVAGTGTSKCHKNSWGKREGPVTCSPLFGAGRDELLMPLLLFARLREGHFGMSNPH